MPLFRGFGRRPTSRRQRASQGWWSANEPDPYEDDYDYYDEPVPATEAWAAPPPPQPSAPSPPLQREPSAALRHAIPRFDSPVSGAAPGVPSWTDARAWTGSSPVPPSSHAGSTADPITDPRGFPPVGRAEPAVDPAEAAALAAAFAADYLSWDETDPQRRGGVIAHYLADGLLGPGSDPARLGWSGRGRQRAEFALPGAVLSDGDGRVTVDVRVRVTPYRVVGAISSGPPEDETEVAGVPAAAPAPTARGWKSLGSYWVRLSVPVTRERGRLVVDASDEQLGGQPPPRRAGPPPAPVADEPDVDGDDVGVTAGAAEAGERPQPKADRATGRKGSNGRRR